MNVPISFGQWLKQRRKALDLTRATLAAKIGCTANTLYKIESDQRRPSRQLAELLAEHLNITAHERAVFVNFARAGTNDSQIAFPWGTAFHPPTNLSAQPTPLIGREQDITTIRKKLHHSGTHLLTLIGPPGVGKTRLALQVATEVLDDYRDGVFFVELAPITDTNLVLKTIAITLDLQEVGPQTRLQYLKAFLRDKQILLILDNFEHILAAAPQIADLLAACLSLKVLVTSRAPLRIRQERQLLVSPLALPDLMRLPDVESVTRYSAVALFLERAQAVKSDFSLTKENVSIVAAICTRLDGLPLAIELISARIKLLTPSALLERLHGRLMLQSDGLRDIESRHRTLNAAIDWSYQLLNADEQKLFRRLSVFVGGWTLEAAEAVCANSLNLNILDGLASLLDKSLVKEVTDLNGEPRFMMLETVREYMLEQLAASDELKLTKLWHADYFAALKENDPHLLVEQQGLWWDRLEVEHENFRSALAWSLIEPNNEIGLRLALALVVFWHLRGYLSEGIKWLTDLLNHHETRTPVTDLGRNIRARALESLATLYLFQGDLDTAQPFYEESLNLMRALDDRAGIIAVLQDYGMWFQFRGEYATSATMLAEGLSLASKLGDAHFIGTSLFFLGTLAFTENQHARAYLLWEDALIQLRTAKNKWGIAFTLANLAIKALDHSDYERASANLTESLILLQELGEKWQIIHTLEGFACLSAVRNQPDFARAARILGTTEFFRQSLSTPPLPYQRQFYERGVAALQSQLDDATIVAAMVEGRAMTLEQAVAYVLNDTF